jgi:hypothetical protein
MLIRHYAALHSHDGRSKSWRLRTAPRHRRSGPWSGRGRGWVVLPELAPDVLQLRPLTGSELDAIGLYFPLGDRWSPSEFERPDPSTAWDVSGGTLLLDAARLALRDDAAPFRSLGRLSFTPRPSEQRKECSLPSKWIGHLASYERVSLGPS